MEFRILGSFEVIDQERPLDLGGARQRLLLARLVVAANQVVALDALLDELWGGDPPPGAKDALQAQVSRARKALGDPARLIARAPGYLLRLGPGPRPRARAGGGRAPLPAQREPVSRRRVVCRAVRAPGPALPLRAAHPPGDESRPSGSTIGPGGG